MLLASNIQILSGVNVRPDPLHVAPVLHDPILHRVGQQQCPAVLLCSGPHKSAEERLHQRDRERGDMSLPSRAPPGIIRWCFVLPTYERKIILGLSAPANPAFMTPVPLSITLPKVRREGEGRG